jgi:N-acetylglucosamine malate deacetylase 1
MNPYLNFVQGIQAGVAEARSLTVSGRTEPVLSEQRVLLFSPHPDDECIFGTLPLRLMREAGMQIINIPVTFGSNPARQADRARELAAACGYLGWQVHREKSDFSAMELAEVVGTLQRFQPVVLFMPHAKDWNSRHISTHFLVEDALKQMGPSFTCTVVETEFWGAMDDPNLMVEADAVVCADLVAATSLHTGEVARNPYHLLLPAWMQDNVRRGGELVGGQGQAAPDFSFATLYRLRRWRNGAYQSVLTQGLLLPRGAAALNEAYPWKSL